MYERIFDLRERAFALSPDPEYLHPSRVHQEAREDALRLRERELVEQRRLLLEECRALLTEQTPAANYRSD